LSKDKLQHKMINIKSYVDAYYTDDPIMNTHDLEINKLYPLSEIKNFELVSDNHRGIVFYPIFSGMRLIYLPPSDNDNKYQRDNDNKYQRDNDNKYQRYDSDRRTNRYNDNRNRYNENDNKCQRYDKQNQRYNSDRSNKRYIHDSRDQRYDEKINKPTHKMNTKYQTKHDLEYIPKEKTFTKHNRDVVAVFKMKKTEMEDVYKLYLLAPSKKNKKIIKPKRIDIAYIPTRERSIYCNNAFKHDKKSIMVKCRYDESYGKWIPIKKVKDKKPDQMSQVDNLVKLLGINKYDEILT